MNRSLLESQLQTLVGPYLPRNANGFKYRVIDALPQPSMWGIVFDPKPFDGKVVALTDEMIIVKTARTQFAVIDRSLASVVPDEGTKVFPTPAAVSTACVRTRRKNVSKSTMTAHRIP